MSIWIITSPSDPVTIDTDDFKLAAFLTCILGNGLYSAKEWTDGTARVVPFLPEDSFEPWFFEQFGKGYEALAVGVDKAELAAVFESMIVGKPEDRRAAVEELEEIEDPKQRKMAWQRINRDRAGTGWQIFEQAEKWADKLKTDVQRMLKAEEKRARKRKVH